MKKLFVLIVLVIAWSLSAYADTKYSDRDRMLISDAISLMDSGKSDQAIAILDSLAHVYPGDNELLYECAYAYHLKGDDAECVAKLKPIYDSGVVSPGQDEICLMIYAILGTAYYNIGQLEKSNEVFLNAIDRWPGAGLLYYNYGFNQLKGGDDKKALDIFEQGIKNAPGWKSNYRGALSLSLQSGSVSKSIFYITTLALLDPSTETFNNLLPLIPKLLDSLVKEKDEGGYDITINEGSSCRSSDLLMAMSVAAGTMKKENQNDNTLDRLVKNLKTSLTMDQVLDIPVIKYLKSMEADDETMLDAFWYFLIGQNYPKEFHDWSATHQAELSVLAQWLTAHPFPQH